MTVDRRGESLWQEWDGLGFTPTDPSSVVFHTVGHVDITNDVVLRSLASAVQREGITESLGQAFTSILPFTSVTGYFGDVLDGVESYVCDESGATYYGDIVDSIYPSTWVEVTNHAR